MNHRFARGWAEVTLLGFWLFCGGCKGKTAAPEPGMVPHRTDNGMSPSDPNCYKTAGAVACPADPKDPSGHNLPAPGSPCHLSVCGVCGSATAPAFRDATGTAKPGWCICVENSDGSGAFSYSCLTTAQWASQPR